MLKPSKSRLLRIPANPYVVPVRFRKIPSTMATTPKEVKLSELSLFEHLRSHHSDVSSLCSPSAADYTRSPLSTTTHTASHSEDKREQSHSASPALKSLPKLPKALLETMRRCSCLQHVHVYSFPHLCFHSQDIGSIKKR